MQFTVPLGITQTKTCAPDSVNLQKKKKKKMNYFLISVEMNLPVVGGNLQSSNRIWREKFGLSLLTG